MRRERDHLRSLWDEIQVPGETCIKFIDQVIGPEICNWRLEEMILLLCGAIGTKSPLQSGTGHMATMTDSRWLLVSTYYLSLRLWQSPESSGYGVLLSSLDNNRKTQTCIFKMLGERDTLKELYIERLCLCFDVFLANRFPKDSPGMKAHSAAVAAVEKEINRFDLENEILKACRSIRKAILPHTSVSSFATTNFFVVSTLSFLVLVSESDAALCR